MKSWTRSLFAASALATAVVGAPALAAGLDEPVDFQIAPGRLDEALIAYSRQADVQVIAASPALADKRTRGVDGTRAPREALAMLLRDSGLRFVATSPTTVTVTGEQGADGGSAGSDAVEALIVTAQKREENIQDVPIAISAFSQEDLTRSQVAGGPDLMTQIPNMTFTKTNFSSYSIQIRGIGTQAISATTDPAVAVAFNNTPFVRNHFFEQEFFDLERIEVLRGPQGTLYGRNATAGVVNILSAKPKFVYEAKASADLGNYSSTRVEGMVNIPLVEDAVALRVAGAWTTRDGFVTNEITGSSIDGRDLWSSRVSLRIAPSDAPFDLNLIWEHFQEDDDRLRSGKQLCKRHKPVGIVSPNGTLLPIDWIGDNLGNFTGSAKYNQGCERTSLYSPEAFQVPNGAGLPYYFGLQGLGFALADTDPTRIGIQPFDPYLKTTQSRDLRVIESTVDPEYRAGSNIFEVQASFDIGDNLTLTSETSYSTDELFSKQDLNRFSTTPGVFDKSEVQRDGYDRDALNNGVFCDPQLGCTNRLVAVDLSTADSAQFSQELRLGSDFDGPFNFSLGANFLRYDTLDKYYVFINTITSAAATPAFLNLTNAAGGVPSTWDPTSDNRECLSGSLAYPTATQSLWGLPDPDVVQMVPAATSCLYIDPNPIGALNDRGHNYFLSLNPYKLISYAAFGEVYYNLTDNLKLTAGLRWTIDRKEAPRLPSMLLAADTVGFTVSEVSKQEWREPTGRLAIDWKPDLSFTDETLVYASYAHGYKAGGANPPPTAVITYGEVAAAGRLDNYALFPRTFEPEFIDAFELGSKNTLLDGTVTLNLAAFYYDYKNYQVSEIVDRAALNRNFDATVWGLEIEADWRPVDALKLGFKGGYEKTRIADGEQAIDLMDRTAGEVDANGNPLWVVAKPFPASPSNCIVPTWLATWGGRIFAGTDWDICAPIINGFDPVTWLPYTANPALRSDPGGETPSSLFASFSSFPANFWQGYPGYDPKTNNNSTGVMKQLGGNELPNAPNWTATITADYTRPLAGDWTMSLHSDLHWQSESWWRVFNDHPYNRLKAFYNLNLAAIFSNEEAGWNVMAYVKNVMDDDSLTGAFLFSDDTGLTTNVFLTEPRLYGLRVTKAFDGGPLLGSFGGRHEGPYPFTLELGGQVQRHDAPYDSVEPSFASAFPDRLDLLDAQHHDLDWGDGREFRLGWRPTGPWKVSLGARRSETNGSVWQLRSGLTDTATCNGLGLPSTATCPSSSPGYVKAGLYSDTDIVAREEHVIVDFDVARDIGFGDGLMSSLGAGVRYARLQSNLDSTFRGIPDWDLPSNLWNGFTQTNTQHTLYEAAIVTDREFTGEGPTLSWTAWKALVGNEDVGRLGVDLSLTGGVLFGKQKTSVTGEEVANYFNQPFGGNFATPTLITPTPVDYSRSTSVTVPLADVSLGIAYEVDRMKISAGYRWERYFDAIDGGFDQHEDADRTIDGPYFKLSVGFGG